MTLVEQIKKDLGLSWVKPGEEFDGSPYRLLWSGEEATIVVDGEEVPAFLPYDMTPDYELGVHKALEAWAKERGYYWESYDPGTYFCYKI